MDIQPPIHDEKYISIPYDLWLSKYKKLEEENERLKSDIDNYKIKVRVSLQTVYDGPARDIGYLQIDVDKGWKVELAPDVVAMVYSELESKCGYYNRYYKSKSEMDYAANKLVAYDKLIDEKIIALDNKLKQLPRIVRWLFNIK